MSNNTTEQFSFVENEHNILNFWQEQQIFKKSLNQTRDGKPYIFYDGPPFATGLPHHGHLVGSILKDIIPRYFTMKGYFVDRRFGWDCHGLPIEYEIDKKLGISAQDAVKKLGIRGYNNECRSIVNKYTNEWKQTITRIGRWVDFENDYKTMDPSFMESVWWVFKQLWEKGLIYKGTRVVPFSTALGTVLSNFEAGQNYQDVQDPTATVLFEIENQVYNSKKVYFAAWTTTPWTLPSNLCLCVNEEIKYALVHDKELDIYFYIATSLMSQFKKKKLEIIKEVLGKDLVGTRYIPLFNYFKNQKENGAFVVLSDDYVTTDAGTGIVHIAPGFGEDDSRVVKEAGLNKVFCCPIDDNGKFTSEIHDFENMYVKDADKLILKRLKQENKLYHQSVIVHSYPFCYRSDTPLLYRAIPSWYVNVEKIKDQLILSNSQIHWVPDHVKDGRFGKWLEGARDWSISRNRIWGTPLPVWYNKTSNKYICLGSFEDIKKYSGKTITDLHRENVDAISFSINGEAGTYERITEVLDCWFESGSMPYAQQHYPFENKQSFENSFPAEFIAEGLDQTRGWFYTLTILSTALFKKPAFKNVIVNGIVMAENGKKMSKRLKNYTPPDKLMEKFGADPLRLYLINSGLVKAEEQRFSDIGVKDMVRRALLPWFNSFKFFTTYANVDNFDIAIHFKESNNITDNWIISKLQTLKSTIADEMSQYHLYNVVPALFDFIENLTNWYIRLNRNRFWQEGLENDKKAAYTTLYTCLREISIAMAPFTPFLSEYIYQELKQFNSNILDNSSNQNVNINVVSRDLESIHLEAYPVSKADKIQTVLEDAVNVMREVILLGRQIRNKANIKVKTPLGTLTIYHNSKKMLEEIKRLETYIKIELNIKKILYSTKEDDVIKLYAKPNSPILGKKLGKDFSKYKKLIEILPVEILKQLESSPSLDIEGRTFAANEILIFREAHENSGAMSNKFITIDIDTTLTRELEQEGLAREVVNRIQKTRKDLNFLVNDRITTSIYAQKDLLDAICNNLEYIQRETLTEKVEVLELTLDNQTTAQDNDAIEFEINLQKLYLNIRVIDKE